MAIGAVKQQYWFGKYFGNLFWTYILHSQRCYVFKTLMYLFLKSCILLTHSSVHECVFIVWVFIHEAAMNIFISCGLVMTMWGQKLSGKIKCYLAKPYGWAIG